MKEEQKLKLRRRVLSRPRKKTIRALRDWARYLKKKMAIAEAINPKPKHLEVQMELLRMELVSNIAAFGRNSTDRVGSSELLDQTLV